MVNYNVNDFTLEHYREIINEAKKKFVFSSFIDFQKLSIPAVLWRHDLDLSIESAYNVAKIEAESGVQSTYFILLHSPFYNLLDLENFSYVKEIIKLNHYIGLHFDSHFYNIQNEEELEKHLINEKSILESLFDIEINVFSFHITNEFTMSCGKKEYGGMVNVYSSYFKENAAYCSDSYGLWRFSRLQDFIKSSQSNLCHVLTHPEWWVFKDLMPSERIEKHIEQLSEKLRKDAVKNYILK